MRSGILLAVVLGGTSGAVADTLHVPGDFPTIQEAIVAAVNGDEVEVHPGTYNETINFLGKAIRVYSTDGADVTIIDGQQNGTVVTCASGEGPKTVIDGFTITGGSGTNGGGMRNIQSSPTVINCIITDNSLGYEGQWAKGAGMSNVSSHPTVINCVFSQNDALNDCYAWGGGMYNLNSNPTVTNCTFDGNRAIGGGCAGNSVGEGGGMYNTNSSPIVSGCNFSGNEADGGKDGRGGLGGGMYNVNGSAPVISDSIFCQNTPNNITGDYTDNGGICLADTCDDANGDGIPDECEPPPPNCPWDLNDSGSVGASDLLILLGFWGPCKGCPADFDENGAVGASDLLALLTNWGPCP